MSVLIIRITHINDNNVNKYVFILISINIIVIRLNVSIFLFLIIVNFYIDKNRTKMTSLKTFEDEDRESSYGFVFAVSGPG